MTWGEIMCKFNEQFPGLNVTDMRPNATNQIYVWVKGSPIDIIATYDEETKTFKVTTTYEKWNLLNYGGDK